MCAKPGEPTLEAVIWGSTLLPTNEPGLGWYPGNRPGAPGIFSPFQCFTKMASSPGPTRNWQSIPELILFICISYCKLIFILQMAVSTRTASGLTGLTVNPGAWRARAPTAS